jgi:hypothetical protein
MTAPLEVRLLAEAWRKWEREPSFPYSPDCCINGTRVVIDALREFDVKARPVSVGVLLFNRFAWDLYQAGIPNTEWPYHAHSIGIDPTVGTVGRDGGWDGHLVAEGDGWTLDISAGAFDRPGRIISPGPRVLDTNVPPTGFGVYTDGHGQTLLMERQPANNRWRQAPGWRPDPDVVGELVDAVGELITVSDTVYSTQTQT